MSANGFANGEKSERDAALNSMHEQDETAEFSVESSTKELQEFEARLERHESDNNDASNHANSHKEEKAKQSNVQTVTQGQHPPTAINVNGERNRNHLQPAMSQVHVQRPAHKPRLTEEELERRLERQQDIADVCKLSNE